MNAQVVLLHGLSRNPRSMWRLQVFLEKKSYRVINCGYPSLTRDFAPILSQLKAELMEKIDPNAPIHFVGHSFGGILVRALLAVCPQWVSANPGGTCVLIGTPNRGSQMASYFTRHQLLKHLMPPVTQSLVQGSEQLSRLAEPGLVTGVIAGTQEFHPLIPASWFYARATGKAAGDGIVELESTSLDSMADFIALPLHHSFMMWDSQLHHQVAYFIENQKFDHCCSMSRNPVQESQS